MEWRGNLCRPLSAGFHSLCFWAAGSCKEVILAIDALCFFSEYSTIAYHAPPPIVRRMPIMLVGVMTRSKMTTARSIVSTCLTLAAKGKKNSLKKQEQTEAGERGGRTSNRHRQRPSFLISSEAHIVEPKRDASIDDQCESLPAIHLHRTKPLHSIELPTRPPVQHALDKRQRAHSHEQI